MSRLSTNQVCVNGMSFSKRESKWANAALVVSLSPQDVADDVTALEGADAGNGPLRGVRWQSAMERRAAEMGGGNLGMYSRIFIFTRFWFVSCGVLVRYLLCVPGRHPTPIDGGLVIVNRLAFIYLFFIHSPNGGFLSVPLCSRPKRGSDNTSDWIRYSRRHVCVAANILCVRPFCRFGVDKMVQTTR